MASFESKNLTDPRPILVIGATGMLGRPVGERLRAEGAAVRVLSRDPVRARALLGEQFAFVPGDVRAPETLGAALAGCRGVHINLRATTVAEFDTVEAEGVAAVAKAARAAGIERLTYLSGAGIEAASPALPNMAAKQAAEHSIVDSGVPYTLLRATHFMESLDLFVRGKRAELLGPQPHRYHYLAAADYAHQVARAYAEPATANTALTLLGPEAFTMREALQMFIARVRPDLKLRETPLGLANVVATLTGNKGLKFAVGLFRAFQQVPETGDRSEADRLVGAATTTLGEWCTNATARPPEFAAT